MSSRATKGTRPRVVRQRQFLSTYIFGAVCLDRDVGCAWVLSECNTGMMQIHLDEIAKNIPTWLRKEQVFSQGDILDRDRVREALKGQDIVYQMAGAYSDLT